MVSVCSEYRSVDLLVFCFTLASALFRQLLNALPNLSCLHPPGYSTVFARVCIDYGLELEPVF